MKPYFDDGTVTIYHGDYCEVAAKRMSQAVLL